ncbi:MAG: Hsp70 family protein, partial [Planctomycetes bacterium]|nr:Hsp70 family protein [Planctomycetota bacterium]
MTIVGIDLGTTNSLVASLGEDGPRTIANEFAEHLVPSVVAVAEDGTLLVGRAAKDRLVVAPGDGRACFKRDMGTDLSYRFGGRQWSPIECSAAVLRELKRIAELALKAPVTSAVISVPAYFHDSQRHATIAAARVAGLAVERIINEPTAAALAFGHSHRDREARLLVFDLGGGTFDVTVLEVFEDVIEVKASGGE